MAYTKMKSWIEDELQVIRDGGLFKDEKVINSAQGSQVETSEGELINFCANNYLGLADHPDVLKAVSDGMQSHGFGMASVRFICGTQDIHKELEARLTEFMGSEDTILYTRASTPTQACSRRCWARRRHHQRRSQTTPASSTVSGFAAPSGRSSPTATWRTWRRSSRRPSPPDSA